MAVDAGGSTKHALLLALLLVVGEVARGADPATLDGKVMFGYQGWFLTPHDGGNVGWRHWSSDESVFSGSTASFDLWPDMSEYTQTETTADLHYADGSEAAVFSSLHSSTVNTHFQWMQDFDLDGVFLQRFLGELGDQRFFLVRNNVTLNVRAAAERFGRTFSVMYDITGVSSATLVQSFKDDWTYLSDSLKVTSSPAYQHHDGRPVVTIWGFGFDDNSHPGTADQAIELVQFLQDGGCFVMAGVPFWWRDGNRDSRAGFMDAYLAFDAISPWSIGRWGKVEEYEDRFRQIFEDEQLTHANGKVYAPVLWPGGSNGNPTRNLTANFNSVPRNGGAFFSSQTREILGRLRRDKTFIYIAMWDEVDEGTAMFKAATRKEDTPVDGTFLYLDIDGIEVPNDHYLRLAGNLKTEFVKPTPDRLESNGTMELVESTCFRSSASTFRVCMQADGNLVIYSQLDSSVKWALGTSTRSGPFDLFMQGDGNVVIYDGQSQPIWAASDDPIWAAQISASTGPYRLILQDSGDLVAFDVKSRVVWQNPSAAAAV